MARPQLSSRTVMLVVLLVLINTPLVHSAWTQWRISSSGVDMQVQVTRTRVLPPEDDPGYYVLFTYDPDVDPDRTLWPAEVDRATYEKARGTGRLEIRALEDQPAAYRAEGQVRSHVGVVLTLLADLALLGMIWLSRKYSGRRRPPPMRIAAIEGVNRGPAEPLIEQVEGELYLVRGEVLHATDDELILDAGEREVIVILDGHPTTVGVDEPAQVRGRLVG